VGGSGWLTVVLKHLATAMVGVVITMRHRQGEGTISRRMRGNDSPNASLH
jgi:hypothetical protein